MNELSDFLTAHQHILGHTVPYDGVKDVIRVPTVRESQGILRSQGKSGKSQGILKYRSLDQLFMHYFHNFCRLLGLCLQTPHPPGGFHPCKHCRLVYIAIFYNGIKFSITFVYLVLFYWCRE